MNFETIFKEELNYMTTSWGRLLQSHIVMNENDPLQAQIFLSVERAEQVAHKYSEQGFKVAVLEWFEDYDMF